jgi:hypothetical protein
VSRVTNAMLASGAWRLSSSASPMPAAPDPTMTTFIPSSLQRPISPCHSPDSARYREVPRKACQVRCRFQARPRQDRRYARKRCTCISSWGRRLPELRMSSKRSLRPSSRHQRAPLASDLSANGLGEAGACPRATDRDFPRPSVSISRPATGVKPCVSTSCALSLDRIRPIVRPPGH